MLGGQEGVIEAVSDSDDSDDESEESKKSEPSPVQDIPLENHILCDPAPKVQISKTEAHVVGFESGPKDETPGVKCFFIKWREVQRFFT